MRLSLGISMAAASLLAVIASPAAEAGLHVYYQEDFNSLNGEGIQGAAPPPATFTSSNGAWDIDVSGATLRNGSDFAKVNGTSFQFRDLGGVSQGTPGSGVAVFTTTAASIFVGNAGNFPFLNMTLNAFLTGASAGSDLLIESLLDNVVVASTSLTAVGSTVVNHNLQPFLTSNTTHSYVLRVTATQDANVTVGIDNILVRGVSTPEPASMSLLGMGVLAMCGAGYRRRRNLSTVET